MSTDMATALVVLAGVILTAVLGLIGTLVIGRRADRRERRDQAGQQIQMIGDMQQRIWWVQQQLPPGGLNQWVDVWQANTSALADHSKSLAEHGQSLAHLADTLSALGSQVTGVVSRVDAHDETLRTLTGAQVVGATGVVLPTDH